MTSIGIIPARYASTRFPGKPLAKLGEKTVIQRVYEQVLKALKYCYVATDDQRIEEAVLSFGGNVILTANNHQSGTDRCAEALTRIEQILHQRIDVALNIQGDEPFIIPQQLQQLQECFTQPEVQIATLVKRFGKDEDILSSNTPKVVFDKNNYALYFSRSVIPFIRNKEQELWPSTHTFYKHIGLYAYRPEVLQAITKLPQSSLELAESLEQLRWLESGYRIKVAITEHETWAIDTPKDLQNVQKHFGL
ncbi:MAG: 3-deoxy-manno-octulosonate cytidylyltransferase [Bacteroidales bacterium]